MKTHYQSYHCLFYHAHLDHGMALLQQLLEVHTSQLERIRVQIRLPTFKQCSREFNFPDFGLESPMDFSW